MRTVELSSRGLVGEIAEALDGGDNECAADLAGQGLAVFSDAAVFHRLRGVALFALGANEEAKGNLAAALTVDPLDNEAIVTLARIADVEGDPYTAAEHLLTAWEHDPANPGLRAELTERLASLYGPEGYLQYTRPALAALYARNAYPRRAAREYEAILAEHPNRTDVRLAAALAQWRLGGLDETVEQCAALLAEQPTVVRARWVFADALARQGRGDTARDHATRAASLDPDGAIARDLLASNRDAAIVDPDEPIRTRERDDEGLPANVTPLPVVAREERTMTTEPKAPEPPDAETPEPEDATPTKSETMRLVESLSGLAAALTNLDAPHEPAATMPAASAGQERQPGEPSEHAPLVREIVFPDDDMEEREAAFAVSDASAPALPHPLDVPYEEPASVTDAEPVPIAAVHEPELIVAVVEEGGAIVATMPGGEPSLDATDVLPNPPCRPEGTRFPTGEGGAGREDVDPMAAMRARVVAGDVVGAVAGMRAALAAAGTDQERVRALLPALRALADAAPQRPDSRRLLGDAYRTLGQYAQAQGQYRQALLVRVAGKGEGSTKP